MTTRIPDELYLAISFQAMANGMTQDQYVQMLQENLDNIYCDELAGTEEEMKYAATVRRTFPAKPTVWAFFIWMLRRAA